MCVYQLCEFALVTAMLLFRPNKFLSNNKDFGNIINYMHVIMRTMHNFFFLNTL